ncbi:hypothetical protein [Candidatus Methylobacter oryzae]|uniref:DUF4145 domain-containing protein n=1 Tax=Candidatus Methylobacter oryzae TaxID=2497749 RepID=A0ABY3C575_9GAMM|nr:hypothetical protein [Candidatus Methylobacter oryzae]TRW90012.1 hypothetical protein EKO24_020545 [Candidatus Methylobacter oryzae]
MDRDNENELKEIEDREFAIYTNEVKVAKDPKLHVLLAHLYVEHLIERYLATRLQTTKGLFGKNGLTFEKKVRLLAAFGEMDTQVIDGMKKLNDMRNDCVHEFKWSIENDAVEEFGRILGKTYKDIFCKHPNQDERLSCCIDYFCGKVLGHVVKVEQTSDRSQARPSI